MTFAIKLTTRQSYLLPEQTANLWFWSNKKLITIRKKQTKSLSYQRSCLCQISRHGVLQWQLCGIGIWPGSNAAFAFRIFCACAGLCAGFCFKSFFENSLCLRTADGEIHHSWWCGWFPNLPDNSDCSPKAHFTFFTAITSSGNCACYNAIYLQSTTSFIEKLRFSTENLI